MKLPLDALPIFRNLPKKLVNRILSLAQVQEFPAGELLVKEGERGHEFFVLVSGTVELLLPDGEKKVMAPGSAFGESALIDRVRRTASVRAREAATVVVLDQKLFDLLFLPGSEERKTLTQNIREMNTDLS